MHSQMYHFIFNQNHIHILLSVISFLSSSRRFHLSAVCLSQSLSTCVTQGIVRQYRNVLFFLFILQVYCLANQLSLEAERPYWDIKKPNHRALLLTGLYIWLLLFNRQADLSHLHELWGVSVCGSVALIQNTLSDASLMYKWCNITQPPVMLICICETEN